MWKGKIWAVVALYLSHLFCISVQIHNSQKLICVKIKRKALFCGKIYCSCNPLTPSTEETEKNMRKKCDAHHISKYVKLVLEG